MRTWYVLEGGQVRQLSDDAFRRQVSSGAIRPHSHVWTEGMPEWVPASKFLEPNLAQPKTSRPYIQLGLVTLVACVTLVFTIKRPELLDTLNEQFGLAPAIFAILAALTLSALVGCALAVKTWQHPDRRKASRFAGLAFMLGAAAAFFEAVILCSFLLQATDTYRMLLAAENYDDAAIISAGNGVAIISGTLGPHLMRDFERLNATSGHIDTVRITSPGGLVTSAIELADYFENHKTTVIIVRECSSACILLAVASPQSYADANVSFGLHHTFPIAPAESEIIRFSYERTWQIYRDFLAQHGVPEAILAEAAKHGADSVYPVTAWDMAEHGAIKGVLSGGKIVATSNK